MAAQAETGAPIILQYRAKRGAVGDVGGMGSIMGKGGVRGELEEEIGGHCLALLPY